MADSQTVATMAPDIAAVLKTRVRARPPSGDTGQTTSGAHANAINGCIPG